MQSFIVLCYSCQPITKELQVMGTTEAEQAEAMKQYIREEFIPTYAENLNKDLIADYSRFYGKIYFDRDSKRSNHNSNNLNVNNMHCHIIVSRKDQSKKKKLLPVTNHRNTKKGAIKKTVIFPNSWKCRKTNIW